MRAIFLILSLALTIHATESMSSLVSRIQAERQRKAMLIEQLKGTQETQLENEAEMEQKEKIEKKLDQEIEKETESSDDDVNPREFLKLAEKAEKEAVEETPVIERDVIESEGVLADARSSVEDQMLSARNKMTEAEGIEQKAQKMATTVESITTEEQRKQLNKLTFEASFLEQEARKVSMRERDTSFVQLEAQKLQKQKEGLLADLKKKADLAVQEKLGMEVTAKVMKEEAQQELKVAEKKWSGVEAVVQENEARPKRMAPKWMIQAQLTEAMDASGKLGAEKQEEKQTKSYLWNQVGKKYTCAPEHSQVQMQAFIMDSNKDQADCLEKQLDKYCLDTLRAPAVSKERALRLVQEPQDCLVKGVDGRVPEKHRAAVASKWCSVVEVLQGVVAQPLKQKYFVLLEDNVQVDPTNFEEIIKHFADTFTYDWDLLQLDPLGRHSKDDMMPSFHGKRVYRQSRNGQYFGFGSVVMKTKSAEQILAKMMSMPAVPLDTLPTLLNEQGDKLSAASLEAGLVVVPKKSSLLQSSKCRVTQSGLIQLQQMSEAKKLSAEAETDGNWMATASNPAVEEKPLDFFAFQREQGIDKAVKHWENRDLTDF